MIRALDGDAFASAACLGGPASRVRCASAYRAAKEARETSTPAARLEREAPPRFAPQWAMQDQAGRHAKGHAVCRFTVSRRKRQQRWSRDENDASAGDQHSCTSAKRADGTPAVRPASLASSCTIAAIDGMVRFHHGNSTRNSDPDG